MASQTERRTQFGKIFIVSSGNFLEMYDFMVFWYYASAIAKAYFPTGSELCVPDADADDIWRRLLDAARRSDRAWRLYR